MPGFTIVSFVARGTVLTLWDHRDRKKENAERLAEDEEAEQAGDGPTLPAGSSLRQVGPPLGSRGLSAALAACQCSFPPPH